MGKVDGNGNEIWFRAQLSPVRIRHNAKISNNLRSISPKLPRGRGVSKRKRRNPKNLVADRSWTRTLAESRGLKKTKKGREREKRRRRKGKIEEGRSRRSQLSATFLPFDRSSLSRRFFHRRIYFRWYQSREKIPAGISSPAPPPSMKSASVGPPTFSAIPSWSARPSIALHFFENVFPHHSSLSSFLSFFRSVFEQKRRHFSTDCPSPLSFLFLSSFHPLASPPRGCTPEARGE